MCVSPVPLRKSRNQNKLRIACKFCAEQYCSKTADFGTPLKKSLNALKHAWKPSLYPRPRMRPITASVGPDVDSKLLDLEERARWENQCMLKFALLSAPAPIGYADWGNLFSLENQP